MLCMWKGSGRGRQLEIYGVIRAINSKILLLYQFRACDFKVGKFVGAIFFHIRSVFAIVNLRCLSNPIIAWGYHIVWVGLCKLELKSAQFNEGLHSWRNSNYSSQVIVATAWNVIWRVVTTFKCPHICVCIASHIYNYNPSVKWGRTAAQNKYELMARTHENVVGGAEWCDSEYSGENTFLTSSKSSESNRKKGFLISSNEWEKSTRALSDINLAECATT